MTHTGTMGGNGEARRDAEAELNLPPGFRFHPSDEELVVHYLCRRTAGLRLPVSIIAEVDLYKFDPWDLPEKALFGQREWYFFSPRDRKYPNGSRPNRAAGTGYWKATGADKPVGSSGGRALGIKKALVFYTGKAPRGVKTDWIMHEYRLADSGSRAAAAVPKKGSLRLDDWVLCRLYNKKNEWEKMQNQKKECRQATPASAATKAATGTDSWGSTTGLHTPESDIDDGPFQELDSLMAMEALDTAEEKPVTAAAVGSAERAVPKKEDDQQNGDWFMDLNLDDFPVSSGFDMSSTGTAAPFGGDTFYLSLFSPRQMMNMAMF